MGRVNALHRSGINKHRVYYSWDFGLAAPVSVGSDIQCIGFSKQCMLPRHVAPSGQIRGYDDCAFARYNVHRARLYQYGGVAARMDRVWVGGRHPGFHRHLLV